MYLGFFILATTILISSTAAIPSWEATCKFHCDLPLTPLLNMLLLILTCKGKMFPAKDCGDVCACASTGTSEIKCGGMGWDGCNKWQIKTACTDIGCGCEECDETAWLTGSWLRRGGGNLWRGWDIINIIPWRHEGKTNTAAPYAGG